MPPKAANNENWFSDVFWVCKSLNIVTVIRNNWPNVQKKHICTFYRSSTKFQVIFSYILQRLIGSKFVWCKFWVVHHCEALWFILVKISFLLTSFLRMHSIADQTFLFKLVHRLKGKLDNSNYHAIWYKSKRMIVCHLEIVKLPYLCTASIRPT